MNKVFKVKKNKFGTNVVTSELATNNGASIVSKLLITGALFASYPLTSFAADVSYTGDESQLQKLDNSNEQYSDEFKDGALGFGPGQNGSLRGNTVTIDMTEASSAPELVYGTMSSSKSSTILSNNTVNLNKGEISNDDGANAYGVLGYAQGNANITATDNTVNLGKDFGYVANVMGAHVVANGDGHVTANNNIVNVTGYQTNGNPIQLHGVEGYTAGNGNITANKNQVNISGATFDNGAEIETVSVGSFGEGKVNINAGNNTLTINDSQFTSGDTSMVVVNLDNDPDAPTPNPNANSTISNNTLTINNSKITPTSGEIAVVDAQLAANISGNTFNITGSTIDNTRFVSVLADGSSGTVANNSLNISDSTISNIPVNDDGIQLISAIQSNGEGTINFVENQLILDNVTLDEGTSIASVYVDGKRNNGSFDGNSVTIKNINSLSNSSIYGVSANGDTTAQSITSMNNNSIDISDTNFTGDTNIHAANFTGQANVIAANNNKVLLTNVDITSASSTSEITADITAVTAGLSTNATSGNFSGNSMTLDNVKMNSDLAGLSWVATVDSELSGDITNNTLEVKNSDMNNTRLVAVLADGASGTVSGNSLNISNSIISNIPDNDDGIKLISAVQSNGEGNIHFSNNTLEIGEGVTFDEGTKLAAVYIENGQNNGTFENNKVVINGSYDLSNVDLYGVYYNGEAQQLSRSTTNVSNSTLEIYSYDETVKVNSVNGFNDYQFYIAGDKVIDDALLTTTEEVNLSNVSTVGVTVSGKASLEKDQTLNLFDHIDASDMGQYEDGVTIRVKQGSGGYYDSILKVTTDENGNTVLESEITSELKSTQSSKALVEPQSTAMAFIGQGGDLVNNQNISESGVDGEWAGFGAMSGSSSRYNTGSHIRVNGYSFLVGTVAKKDKLSVGTFFESGFGNYNTHNDSLDGNEIYGSGKTSYKGLGIIGRYDITPTIYSDINMRAGRAKIDFDSSDLAVGGVNANYDTHSTYFSASLGVGKLLQMTDNSTLDLKTRYTYTYLQGKDAETANDTYDFANTHSNRAQVDGIYSVKINDWVMPYIGVGYQYEFSGKSKGVISGVESDETSLQGSTGLLQIGLKGNHEQLSYKVGLNGYTGKREGVIGSVGFEYRF